MAEDDDRVFGLSGAQLQARAQAVGKACSCEGATGSSGELAHSWTGDLRRAYAAIRPRHNYSLAKLLSEHYRKDVAWDSPLASIVRGWVYALDHRVGVWRIIGVLFNDVTILNKATLNLSSSVSYFRANRISIHAGGVLKINSSYIRIVCASVQGNLP
jgi:hypothetical protein